MSDKSDLFEFLSSIFWFFVGVFCVMGVFGWIFGIGSPVVIISQGDAGVGFNYFTGEQKEDIFTPGMTFIAPWTIVYEYSTLEETQRKVEIFTTSDGAKVPVTSCITYKVNPDSLGEIHKTYKKEYFQKAIEPAWSGTMGETIEDYKLEYFLEENTNSRKEVGEDVFEELSDDLWEKGIILCKIEVPQIELPEGVSTAINMEQELKAGDNNTDFVTDYKHAEAVGKNANKVVVASA